jgi:wyosine [tRNA(Phe)-imidazoG37] synthetase (radical SAM superfamily)
MNLDLKRLHLEMGKMVYGPVLSRRFGWSLGVNPLPLDKKTCSLDCVYCQLGRTDNPVSDPNHLVSYPSYHDIAAAVERKVLGEESRVDVVTFSGNGEPTLYPELRRLVDVVRQRLDARGLEIPISILTNSTPLHSSRVRASLRLFDHVIAKLDTANQDCFQSLNRPVADMNVRNLVDQLSKLRSEIGAKLILQTIIVDSRKDRGIANHSEERFAELVEAVQEINPAHVQIYTVDREPAEPHVVPVDRVKLDSVAKTLALTLGEDRVHVY